MKDETYYVIKLARGGDWSRVSGLIGALKGKPGLSINFDSYVKVYTLTVWDETTKEVVRLMRHQIEELGGVWKVAV